MIPECTITLPHNTEFNTYQNPKNKRPPFPSFSASLKVMLQWKYADPDWSQVTLFFLVILSFLSCVQQQKFLYTNCTAYSYIGHCIKSQTVIKLIKTQFYPCPLSSHEFGFYHKH